MKGFFLNTRLARPRLFLQFQVGFLYHDLESTAHSLKFRGDPGEQKHTPLHIINTKAFLRLFTDRTRHSYFLLSYIPISLRTQIYPFVALLPQTPWPHHNREKCTQSKKKD